MNKQKINQIVGSIGAFIGIIVFIAYIPQIIANLQGNKAQPFQPLSAAISCLIWVIYGWTKEPKKDWILIIPNSAGVILGGLTFLNITLIESEQRLNSTGSVFFVYPLKTKTIAVGFHTKSPL